MTRVDVKTRLILSGAALAVLAAIAAVASSVRQPDSYWYTDLAEHVIVPGCSSIACFRVLVAWVLGLFPGVELKWKIYSVIFNALAGVAVFELSCEFGLTRRGALTAMAFSALGFGSLYTLFEPFNSDPLMFFLGPLLTVWLLRERTVRVFVFTAVGVLAKEFVVAPLAMFAIANAAARRWRPAAVPAAAAAGAVVVWLGLHFWLIHWHGYNYAGNASTKLTRGGYLYFWLTHEPLSASVLAQFVEFGALYILAPFGFMVAPPRLRALTLAAIPIACVFGYVQQPDRALWNFHFLVSPLAALALEAAPGALVLLFVLLFGLADLRVGAQVSFMPGARYALVASCVIAIVAVVKRRHRPPTEAYAS